MRKVYLCAPECTTRLLNLEKKMIEYVFLAVKMLLSHVQS